MWIYCEWRVYCDLKKERKKNTSLVTTLMKVEMRKYGNYIWLVYCLRSIWAHISAINLISCRVCWLLPSFCSGHVFQEKRTFGFFSFKLQAGFNRKVVVVVVALQDDCQGIVAPESHWEMSMRRGTRTETIKDCTGGFARLRTRTTLCV